MPGTENDRRQRERQFHGIYQANYSLICDYAVRRTRSADDAADVVAEVFMIAWRRLGAIPSPPQDRLWLYGVARRVISGSERTERRRRTLLARLQTVSQPRSSSLSVDQPEIEVLRQALGQLRSAEREALRLVVWEQLTHAEAAQVLGCSANAVGIRVHKARKRLHAALTNSGSGGLPIPERPGRAEASQSGGIKHDGG